MPLIHEETFIRINQRTAEGRYLNLDSGQVAFSIDESIYSLNRNVQLGLQDLSGESYNYHLYDPGCEFNFEFGVGKTRFNNTYRILSTNYGAESPNKVIYSPYVNMSLTSTWIDDIIKKSNKYSDRISNIIRSIASDNNFTVDINDTGNFFDWYQLRESDKQFLKRISNYAYSDNSFNTPFFLYQTQDNKIHFRNGYSLENQKSKITFLFLQPGAGGRGNGIEYTIQSLQRIDDGSFSSREFANIQALGISRETGEAGSINLLAGESPSQVGKKKILIANSELEGPTKIQNIFFKEEGSNNEENQKGLIINALKNNYFTEKYMFVVPTSPDIFTLRAGDKISLRIPKNNISLSQDYIIEKKSDVFNPKDKSLLTVIVIGRRTADIWISDPNYDLFPSQ